MLLFPLAIGFSVDGLLDSSYFGLGALGGLCVAVLVVGAGRRFYDTRAYAGMYRQLATALVEHERGSGVETTRTTARVGLLNEVVDFFENTLPELLGAGITFVGTIVLLAIIDFDVVVACLVSSVLVGVVYIASWRRIFEYNRQQNDELEQRVSVLSTGRRRRVDVHFRRLLKWNVKLSDLETLNFSAVWLVMAAMLLVCIVLVVGDQQRRYGQMITTIMYVFEYVEVVMTAPLYYQQWVRLSEITSRLSNAMRPPG